MHEYFQKGLTSPLKTQLSNWFIYYTITILLKQVQTCLKITTQKTQQYTNNTFNTDILLLLIERVCCDDQCAHLNLKTCEMWHKQILYLSLEMAAWWHYLIYRAHAHGELIHQLPSSWRPQDCRSGKFYCYCSVRWGWKLKMKIDSHVQCGCTHNISKFGPDQKSLSNRRLAISYVGLDLIKRVYK